MKISSKDLAAAVQENIITEQQALALDAFLLNHAQDTPQFSFTHVLYYMGGLIAIGAMTLFMNLGWEAFGGAGIFFISLLYAGVAIKITNSLAAKSLHIPAGICATFVVCLVPLMLYGLQQWLGVWPGDSEYQDYHHYIRWHWLYMELGTLLVGVIIAWKYKYPFLLMPIAVTLWYITMDLTAVISGGDVKWELRLLVSLYSGLLMILLAFWVDIRSRTSLDYAFWLYIFGVIAFWSGLSMQNSDSEFAKFMYFCINLMMIGIGVILVRRIFVIFGALGCCGYLGHLAADVFADSWLFPISLTGLGLFIVYLGVVWQKNEQKITHKCRSILPVALRELLESKH